MAFQVKGLTASIALTFSVISFSSVAANDVYVQASSGSFNNAAINSLYTKTDQAKPNYVFSGTPLQTFIAAVDNSALAFTALENSTIEGNLVRATVAAVQEYQVEEVQAGIRTAIEMCVLRSKTDVKANIPLTQIASHPAALKQIDRWKGQYSELKELEIPKGTAEAARMVATGELPSGTAAIGACMLEELYPQVTVTAKAIQDNQDNKTLFALMKVSKRAQPLSVSEAEQALRKVIQQAEAFDAKL
ncbi:prephenate dehydratase [Photobacterium sanctipauli]|uniref:Prephenate dehydratase n=1 Tax=Photobacterium sanctipauli TaxID=1342794 RepID=A0A2T3NIM3_9GAMM|nr:prephenate dehydratase domain-containing protein [Photobacterium sanctipauli]PSW14803.1 prephenate dehydratase [Photobacterium sanctipauli]